MAAGYDVVTPDEYTDKRTGEKKTKWVRLGVAWKQRDGDGFDIRLSGNPVNGRLIVRAKREYVGINDTSDGGGTDGGGNTDNIPF